MELSKQTAAEVAADKHIRDVIDTTYRKPNLGSVTTPREDTKRLHPGATSRDLAVDCECIVEMYELLWRWGNLDRFKNRNFFMRFGFSLPESIVFVRGRPYAWYFVSKKDGSLLRKRAEHLSIANIEKRLCSNRNIATHGEICATWIPMSSQFADERSKTQRAMFLTPAMCANFLRQLDSGGGVDMNHGTSLTPSSSDNGALARCPPDYKTFYGGDNRYASGVLQEFCVPNGVSNYLIRAVEYKGRISIAVRTNRQCMIPGRYLKAKQQFEETKAKQGVLKQEYIDSHSLATQKLLNKAKIPTAVMQRDIGGVGNRANKQAERAYHERVWTESRMYMGSARSIFIKAATFEGWAGLSGVTYGYEKRCKNQSDLFTETVVEEEATRKMSAAQREKVRSQAHQILTQSPTKLMGTNQLLLHGGTAGNGGEGGKEKEGEDKKTEGANNRVNGKHHDAAEGDHEDESQKKHKAKDHEDDDGVNEVAEHLDWWQQKKVPQGSDRKNESGGNRYIDRIVPVAKALMARIKQERVRQMHFLQSHQFIALHFKIDRFKKFPNFIFASIIPENDVIVQCQEYLVMSTNESMKERLPRECLLKGGVVHLSAKRRLHLGGSEGVKQGEQKNYMRNTLAFESSTKFIPSPQQKKKKKKRKSSVKQSVKGIPALDSSSSSSNLTASEEDEEEGCDKDETKNEDDMSTPTDSQAILSHRDTVVSATPVEDYSMDFDSPTEPGSPEKGDEISLKSDPSKSDGKSEDGTTDDRISRQRKSILRKVDDDDGQKKTPASVTGAGRRLSFAPNMMAGDEKTRISTQETIAEGLTSSQTSLGQVIEAGKSAAAKSAAASLQETRGAGSTAGPSLVVPGMGAGAGNKSKGKASDKMPGSEPGRWTVVPSKHVLNRPKLRYPYPKVPEAPFKSIPVPHSNGEAGRFEYPPPFLFGMPHIKHPLIKFGKQEQKNGDFDKIM